MGRTVQAITNMIDEAYGDGTLNGDDLEIIGNHINYIARESRRLKEKAIAISLLPGSAVRIRLDAHIRPRYVLGTNATIQKINRTTATIVLGHVASPDSNSKFYTGQIIRCPLHALEPMTEVPE
jgi:hypothetical protein